MFRGPTFLPPDILAEVLHVAKLVHVVGRVKTCRYAGRNYIIRKSNQYITESHALLFSLKSKKTPVLFSQDSLEESLPERRLMGKMW